MHYDYNFLIEMDREFRGPQARREIPAEAMEVA